MVKIKSSQITFINVFSAIALQFIIILNGLIVPKLILDTFGSEINGLVTSVTQFLNYISLLEGGIGSVILANLYKPLANHDTAKVSAILVAANNFFKKLALFFVIYQIALMILYPFITESTFSWEYIALLVLILGIGTFIQYYFSIVWRLFLQADKKLYIVSFTQGLVIVLNTVATYLGIKLLPNIHFVKLISGLVYLIQPIILNYYIQKHYSLDPLASPDSTALAQRWDGFGINIAATIHTSTATAVLTIILGFNAVSIFSVYYLAVSGLKKIITSISSGITPSMGNSLAKNEMHRLNSIFNIYDLIIFLISTICFTVGGLTNTSFVLLYTHNIQDANYYQPILSSILMLAEFFFCIREPYINIAYVAGHFKQVSKYAYLEAILNIILSIIFTLIWGINGVALGLLISVIYRTFCQAYYVKKNIIHRELWPFIRKLIASLFSSITTIVVVQSITLTLTSSSSISVLNWIISAIIALIISCLLTFISYLIFCYSELKLLKKLIHKN